MAHSNIYDLYYIKVDMKRNLQWYIQMSLKTLSHPELMAQRLSYNFQRFKADQAYRSGKYNYPDRIFFLAGLALGGTTWMKNLLARIPGVYTRPTPMPEDIKYRQDICDSAFSCIPKYGNMLFKTHLNPKQENLDCLKRNGIKKVLVTYRDFRDVALSHYHRLIQFPKSKDAFDYKDYRAMTKEDGLNDMIEDTANLAVPWVRGWVELAKKEADRIIIVRFEDLKENTKKHFERVLNFYGVELSEETINKIIEGAKGKGSAKKNIKASEVQPWGVSSNFRKGEVGGWRKEFSESNMKKAKEFLTPGLIEFGYEKDENWS